MTQDKKAKDLSYQAILDNLNGAMAPLAKLADKCLGDNPPTQEILETVTDSLVLLSNVFHKLNMKRREAIKPDLKHAYKSLCSTNNPITGLLLGDDLSKTAKEAKETDNVTNIMSANGYSRKHMFHEKPGPGGYPFGSQRPFLGRGGSSSYRAPQSFLSQRGRGNNQRRPYRRQ